jgi:hypothetical protein
MLPAAAGVQGWGFVPSQIPTSPFKQQLAASGSAAHVPLGGQALFPGATVSTASTAAQYQMRHSHSSGQQDCYSSDQQQKQQRQQTQQYLAQQQAAALAKQQPWQSISPASCNQVVGE